MTDFIGLQLGLDTSQFTSGARSAQQALAGIEQSTVRASSATIQYTGSMNSLFTRRGAIGSLGQVAQGIDSVTRAATSGSPAMAALSASFLALEIGKTVGDFKEMAAATKVVGAAASDSAIGMGIYGSATAAATTANTAAVSGFARVFSVLRANPLLALAGVAGAVGGAITIVSSVMTLFGSSTAKATKAVKEQVDALEQLKGKLKDIEYRKQLTGKDSRTSTDAAFDVLTGLRSSKETQLTAKDAARLFGVTEEQMRAALAKTGLGEAALEQTRPRYAFDYTGQTPRRYVSGYDYSQEQFSRESVISAGETFVRSRAQAEARPSFSAREPGDIYGFSRMNLVSQTPEERKSQEEFDRKAVYEQHQEALRQMADLAGQVGANLGAGAADMLFKLRSAQDVLKSLLQSMVASGLQSAGQAIFSGLAKGIGNAFSTTPEQSSGGGGGLVIDGENVTP